MRLLERRLKTRRLTTTRRLNELDEGEDEEANELDEGEGERT